MSESSDRRIAHLTRRRLLGRAGGLAVATVVAFPADGHGAADATATKQTPISSGRSAARAATGSLIDQAAALCSRLEGGGWRTLLLRVTDGQLDIATADLPEMLARPLSRIDRAVPGFEDFSLEGTRGIEPGSPARSLLYHAVASPNVFEDGSGTILTAFPTPAELDVIENYVYGVAPPSLDEIRTRAAGDPLAIVVFALEYRSGRETVHRKHADLCFSRTGHARLGTTVPRYDARRREFLPTLPDDPFAFPVQPARYAAFLAVRRAPDPASFGPIRVTEDDGDRRFWVPLHKLFDGPECLEDVDITLELTTDHVNEKLRRFHAKLNLAGFYTGWSGPDLDQFPFVIAGDTLAAFSDDADHGPGWVMPLPHPLAEPARYGGEPLSYFYSEEVARIPNNVYFSGLQLFDIPSSDPLGPERTQYLPENVPGPNQTFPRYLSDIGPDGGRGAPEYLNVRRRVAVDGTEENLNELPELLDVVRGGGYWARHFIDYSADGWVSARCIALDTLVPERVPAYSMISPPTFYPYTNQRELTEWAETSVPADLRDGIWAIPPRPLSDRRLAANVDLPAGFDIDDDTMTAIVSHPAEGEVRQTPGPATFVRRHLLLPDGAAGLFDPGWDISLGRTVENKFFMESYGLGTPFIEDVKICAALSSFWPGVAPDAAREFQPDKAASGSLQAWPTIAPVSDEEMGIVEASTGGYLPWDGVRGPVVTSIDGRRFVDYPDIYHTDYLDTVGAFTAALTVAVDHEEYTARVFAMAQTYWSLGVRYTDYATQYALGEALDRFQAAKAEWAVLSFRRLADRDEEIAQAEDAVGVPLSGERLYRVHLFRWDGSVVRSDDVRRVLVPIEAEVVVYADLTRVLVGRDDGTWELVEPPTLLTVDP